MSSFIVGEYHLSYLVSALGREKIYNTKENEYYTDEEIVNVLHRENVRSVNARYPDHETEPDRIGFAYVSDTEAVQALKALQCYEYQACETGEFAETEAGQIARRMQSTFTRKLKGYEDADWEVTAEARDRRHAEIRARIRKELNLKY